MKISDMKSSIAIKYSIYSKKKEKRKHLLSNQNQELNSTVVSMLFSKLYKEGLPCVFTCY